MHCLFSKENMKKANRFTETKSPNFLYYKEEEFVIWSGLFSSDRRHQLIAQIIKEYSFVVVRLTSIYECLFK